MKKFLLFVVFSLFLLPFAVMGQCGSNALKATDADGNSYASLKVGPHCWTQFNLKTKAEGSFIYKSDMYPDTTANLGIYGRLYNWYAAMNIQPGQTPVVGEHNFVQGICPEGWHLPNEVEVTQLMTNTTPTLHDVQYWLVPGTNTTTYTMRPGGYYNAIMNRSENLCGNSFMWTAQSLDENNPLVVWSDCHCDHFIVDKAIATDGMSVRCVYKIYQGEVTTDSVKEITDQSATLYGTVAFNGYDEEYERGFVYGTSSDNLDQWVVENQAASEATAPFNKEITGLSAATTYYYQAYVVNDFDTAWGEIKDFTTLQMQVSTDSANTITHYAATLHGNLIYLDYASVNAGFKYGTSESALTSISEVSTLSNPGQYSATLEGLAEGTTYFFKAFAANGTDTVYGEVKSFTTKDIAVAANAATNVQSAAATLNGELTILKGYEDAKGGFRYGQHKNYMVFFAEKEDAMTATGSYSVDLSNISPNTTYYFQAYAYNGIDTAWAADTLTFTTLTVPCLGAVRANERATELGIDSVLDNEGNSYITVQIGNQCWMAENLRATKYQNSEVIDSDIPSTATSTTTPYMYYPKGQETLVGSLGYLYNYPAVADNRNICPEGWHIPTDGEWFALEKQVLDLTSADSTRENVGGTKVGKMTAGIDWTITTVETAPGNMLYTYRNNSGFSAYPSHFLKNGSFQSDVEGYFWSSTEKDNDNAWGRGITSTDQGIYRWPQYNKSYGFSVRCVRDDMSVTTDSANTVTNNTATLHGNVTDMGGKDNVYVGFKYGTSESTLTSIASDESAMYATGRFSYTITGLTANTQYYYKAFAANGTDTVYGEVKDFTTAADIVTDTIAFLPNGGQGTMDTMFVTRGDTVLNANTYTHDGNWQFIGWNTAADGSGTQYADQDAITTNGNLTLYAQWHTWCTGIPKTSVNEFGTSRIDSVKDIDNNKYNVVQIGNQCWMKENLRTHTNGADTGNIYTPTTPGYDVETYGRLYDWYAVMQGASSSALAPSGVQGICPAGWHVPSSNEWDTLTNYVNSVTEYRCGGTDKAIAKSLAATMGWNPNNNACRIGNLLSHNNATGFSALPAGRINSNNPQSHIGFGKSTLIASATVGSSDTNYCAELLNSISPYVDIMQNTQSVDCISVRCLRDAEAPAAMSVTTDSANTVTNNTATLHGTVTNMGGKDNVYAGFKYGTSESALTSIASDGSAMYATGRFSYTITGLTANTQYYFKAFAANGTDTVYGEVKNFTTLTDVVTDTIAFVPNGGQGAMDTMFVTRGDTVLNANTYTHGGNWHFDGWNTAADGSGTQYADQDAITTNGNLTLYAQWHTWCTGIPKTSVNEFGTSRIDSVKDIDNNKYNVVQIGNQCWLKENLRTLTNGADTGNIYTPTTPGYDVETYGLLYDWAAVMQGASSSALAPSGVQGICPDGWHVPSSNEWDTLTYYVNGKTEYQCNGDKTIAKALASATGWNNHDHDCNVGNLLSSNNATGFCALPAGIYYPNNTVTLQHLNFGNWTLFSSATVGMNDNCCTRGLANASSKVSSTPNTPKVNGLSVRCLRDAEAPAAMSVTTDSANTVTNNTATLYGNVTDMGGKDNVYAGFKYGTSESTLTSIASDGSVMYATGRFSYTITGLTANTQYYYKAFAANGTDTVYGEVKDFTTAADVFTCGTSKVKDIEDNEYNTVQIGNQCWMAENMRCTTSPNGLLQKGETGSSSFSSPLYYDYQDATLSLRERGLLYNWYGAMDTTANISYTYRRGICPEGWHVPSDAEWTQLTTYVKSVSEYVCDGCSGTDYEGYTNCIANALSSATGWTGTSLCGPGYSSTTLNKTGFSAVPAGVYYDGDFLVFGLYTYFWSATQPGGYTAGHLSLNSYDPGVVRSLNDKDIGYSVRCLKD